MAMVRGSRLRKAAESLPESQARRADSWISCARSRRVAGQRLRLGEIALQKGLITRRQLDDALRAQSTLRKLGLPEKLGSILLKKKHITEETLSAILGSSQVVDD